MRQMATLLLMLSFCTSCHHGTVPAEPSSSPTTLVILHTNDTHGYIWGTEETGSAAQRGHVIQSVREELARVGGVVVVLDAGDVRTGTYCSDRQRSEPDLECMDAMGYDAMVVGNHEFDAPYSVILGQRSQVDFPILGANIVSTETGQPLLDPITILERGGLRVGIVGLVTAESATTSTTGADPAIRFEDATEAARRYVAQLQPQVDVVIVLSHLGLEQDRRLAQSVQGIDVIVGGHSHDALPEPLVVGSTVVAQAGNYGEYVGRVDLSVSSEGVELLDGRLIRVTTDLPVSQPVMAVLERFACDDVSEVIVELDEPITREPLGALGTSSGLSNLCADAMRSAAETDLAIMNRGGIRADLPAGPITASEIHGVLPFDNNLVVLEPTGAQLVDIATSVRDRGPDGRGVLFTSGMQFVFGPEQRVQVMIDGEPADPARRYSLALSSFIAEGGDRHDAIARLDRIRELSVTSAQAFAAYLRDQEQVTVDRTSRTTWVQETEVPAPTPKSLFYDNSLGKTDFFNTLAPLRINSTRHVQSELSLLGSRRRDGARGWTEHVSGGFATRRRGHTRSVARSHAGLDRFRHLFAS